VAEITGLNSLISKLKGKITASIQDHDIHCLVGFEAKYAIFIHENMEIWPPGMRLLGKKRPKNRGMYWDPQPMAQPKFLEAPARMFAKDLAMIVTGALKRGATFVQAVTLAGMRLLHEAQLRVPVDTGNLRASGFVRIDHDRGGKKP
jgi:hypothetical protein